MTDTTKKERRIPVAAVAAGVAASVNAANIGYDIGVSTNVATIIEEHFLLTEHQKEVFLGALPLMTVLGTIASQWFSDRFGRRVTFGAASIAIIIGLLAMVTSDTYFQLVVGRALVGTGVGLGYSVDFVYIAEISLPAHRGEMSSWIEIASNFGSLFGFATAYLLQGFAPADRWRWICALGLIPPVTVVITLFLFMPESPQWLVLQGLNDEARLVVQKIYPSGTNPDSIIKKMQEANRREELASKLVGWAAFCDPSPSLRRQLLVTIVSTTGDFAVGVELIQYYLWDILEALGVESEETGNILLIVFGALNLMGIILGAKLLDMYGRRKVMFASMTGTIIGLQVLALSFYMPDSPPRTKVALACLLFSTASLSSGYSCGAWLLPGEIFSTSLRAKGVSLVAFVAYTTNAIYVSNFLSLKNIITWPGCFFLSAFFGACTLTILYLYLPETSGKTLEEISVSFAEETNDFSMLEAQKKIAAELEAAKHEQAESGATKSEPPDTEAAEDDK